MRILATGKRSAPTCLCVLLLVLGLAGQATGEAALQRAHDLVEWGRLKEARSLLQTATAVHPDNAKLLAYFGHVQALFGDLHAARDLTKQAVKLDAQCASCHLYRFEAMAEHAETLSQFRALLALHGIKKELAKAESLDPNLADVQWGWIRLELTLPAALGGSTADAYKHAALLGRLDPVDGRLAQAHIAQKIGDSSRALEDYRAAASAHPQDPRGVFALGRALYANGDYAGAIAPLSHAWALNHQSALYAAYYAADLVRLQKLPEARSVLAAAQQQHPDSRLGDFLTAQALAATGQDADWAKQLLARYLAVAPEPDQPTTAEAQNLFKGLASAPTSGRLQNATGAWRPVVTAASSK